jgi:hypothetical protein
MFELVFTQDGPWVLLVAVICGGVWFIATHMVPKSYLRELKSINDRVWEAYERERAAHDVTRKQHAELIEELGRTSTKVLTAPLMPAAPPPEGDDGDAHAVA